MFVRTTYIPENGETLTLQLIVRTGTKMRLRGSVVRSYRVPSNLRRYVASGFAIRIDEAPEEYFQLLASLFSLRLAGTG